MAAWTVICFPIPTIMTKLLYLNPFYPRCAGRARLFVQAASVSRQRRFPAIRRVATIFVAFVVAESQLVWYSSPPRTHQLDAGLCWLNERSCAGRRSFATLDAQRKLVLKGIVGAEQRRS